jgi:hypothetical protein
MSMHKSATLNATTPALMAHPMKQNTPAIEQNGVFTIE